MINAAPIPFHTTDWSRIDTTEHAGEIGMAFWKTLQPGNLRVRLVEYTAGYKADHWCSKGAHYLLHRRRNADGAE